MDFLLPLVLISIGCISTAEPQTGSEIEVNSTKPEGEEPPSVQRQDFLPDIISMLVDINMRLAKLEGDVKSLKRDREVRQVAFSAALVDRGSVEMGPHSAARTLIFRKVFENIGNAYNFKTGIFTAPVRGAYHFEFYIYGEGHRSYPTEAWMMKNSQYICLSLEHQPSYSVKSANAATLLLEVGDVVYLRQGAKSRIFDNENHHTTFSGHLLFTM